MHERCCAIILHCCEMYLLLQAGRSCRPKSRAKEPGPAKGSCTHRTKPHTENITPIGDFQHCRATDFDLDNARACWRAIQIEVMNGVTPEQLTALEQVLLQIALTIAQTSRGADRYIAVQHLHAVALPIGNRLHNGEVQAVAWRHWVMPVSDSEWPSYGMSVAFEHAVVPGFPRDFEQLATTTDINMMTARLLSSSTRSTACMLTADMEEVVRVCNIGLQVALTSIASPLQRIMQVAVRHGRCLLIPVHIPGGAGHFVSIAVDGARRVVYTWDSLGSFPRSIIAGLQRSSGWPVVNLQLTLQFDAVHCGFWTVWFCEMFMVYVENGGRADLLLHMWASAMHTGLRLNGLAVHRAGMQLRASWYDRLVGVENAAEGGADASLQPPGPQDKVGEAADWQTDTKKRRRSSKQGDVLSMMTSNPFDILGEHQASSLLVDYDAGLKSKICKLKGLDIRGRVCKVCHGSHRALHKVKAEALQRLGSHLQLGSVVCEACTRKLNRQQKQGAKKHLVCCVCGNDEQCVVPRSTTLQKVDGCNVFQVGDAFCISCYRKLRNGRMIERAAAGEQGCIAPSKDEVPEVEAANVVSEGQAVDCEQQDAAKVAKQEHALAAFVAGIQESPTTVFCSCHGLWFRSTMRLLSKEKVNLAMLELVHDRRPCSRL